MTTFPLSEVLALAHLPALIGSKRGKMQDALDAHALAMLPELVAALEDTLLRLGCRNCDDVGFCRDCGHVDGQARSVLARAQNVPMP